MSEFERKLLETLDGIWNAIVHVQIVVLCGALLVAAATCVTAGCVPAPMTEWRDEVAADCAAVTTMLETSCTGTSLHCTTETARADGAGCLGPWQVVLECYQTHEPWVACLSATADAGSLCEIEEWAYRTCLYPELAG